MFCKNGREEGEKKKVRKKSREEGNTVCVCMCANEIFRKAQNHLFILVLLCTNSLKQPDTGRLEIFDILKQN